MILSAATDTCTNGQNDCSPTADGGICTLVDSGPTFTCACRDAWVMQAGGKICKRKSNKYIEQLKMY